jgi:hypothetical protein
MGPGTRRLARAAEAVTGTHHIRCELRFFTRLLTSVSAVNLSTGDIVCSESERDLALGSNTPARKPYMMLKSGDFCAAPSPDACGQRGGCEAGLGRSPGRLLLAPFLGRAGAGPGQQGAHPVLCHLRRRPPRVLNLIRVILP